MKTRTILFTLLLCFVVAAVCFADDPHMGTWKLNEAKSKIGPGAPKITTVVYEAAGDSIKKPSYCGSPTLRTNSGNRASERRESSK
jgi:hypothetical protein